MKERATQPGSDSPACCLAALREGVTSPSLGAQ